MVLRQRRKPVSEIVTELDAFPKVPDTYVEYTLSGAYGEHEIKYRDNAPKSLILNSSGCDHLHPGGAALVLRAHLLLLAGSKVPLCPGRRPAREAEAQRGHDRGHALRL